MKKRMMFLTLAALLFLIPQGGNAQEDGDAAENEGKTETAAGKKSGKNASEKKPAEPAKKTIFSAQQGKIKNLQERLKKARKRNRRQIVFSLRQEQNKLKAMLKREVSAREDRIHQLQELIRISDSAQKQKLESELQQKEEQIKTLKADADLETWCGEKEIANEKDAESESDETTKRQNKKNKKKK